MGRRLAGAWCVAIAAAGGCAMEPEVVDGGDLVTRGAASVARRGCPACHDPGDNSLSGQTVPIEGTASYGANLTPDEETGLGGWSDAQIVTALRSGLDDEWVPLCPPMPRFPVGDDEAQAIVAFLRSLPPVHKAIPASSCAPDVMDEPDDAGVMPGPTDDAGMIAADDGSLPVPDAALAVPDAAMAVDAGAFTDGDSLADAGVVSDLWAPADITWIDSGSCVPRINEVQTAGKGGASDEFVEIVNPCCAPIDLAGWHLVYRSSAGIKDVTLAPLAGLLAPGAFLVCGGHDYSGPAAIRFGDGLAADGGGLGLRDGADSLLDSMAWGKATNAFLRGNAAPAPPAGQSIGRSPDGNDSGDNAVDFALEVPTPGCSNP